MAILPSRNISTANLDSGTDNPRTSRSDLKLLAQDVDAIINAETYVHTTLADNARIPSEVMLWNGDSPHKPQMPTDRNINQAAFDNLTINPTGDLTFIPQPLGFGNTRGFNMLGSRVQFKKVTLASLGAARPWNTSMNDFGTAGVVAYTSDGHAGQPGFVYGTVTGEWRRIRTFGTVTRFGT